MTPAQSTALTQINVAMVCLEIGMESHFRTFMKAALGSINQIEDLNIRKAAARQWFRAYNITNTRLQKEAL